MSCESEAAMPTSLLGPTLADLLELVPGLDGVSAQARQNMKTGIRTLCRLLDRQPQFVPIAATALRKMFDEALPAAAGVSVSNWRNVKTNVRRAIKLSSLSDETGVADVPLSDAWQRLIDKIPNSKQRGLIRRFARFCSGCQVAPTDVDDAILAKYHAFLEATQLYRDPVRSVIVLAWAWNKAVAREGTYPRLNPPSRSRKYALDWADLPPSLVKDVQAFHDSCLNPDLFDPASRRPASPVTIQGRDYLMRRFASALVSRGIDVNDLRCLADLFRPERLKEGIRFFLARNDNKPCSQVPHFINLALIVAKRWAKLPPDQIAEIQVLSRNFNRPQTGLTRKNRNRVRQFADDRAARRLFKLPGRLVADAKKRPPTYRTALKVQMALAIELLIFAPIRVGNLVRLDRHRHFHWARSNGDRVLHLVIPAVEVKNDVDLEFPLLPETVALLDLYMTAYQPVLDHGHPSGLLFPGRNCVPKNQPGFSRQITAIIGRETGLKMNPHLFRHVAAHFFLEDHPGHYEDVRRLLAHKKIDTTLQNYAGMEMAAAVRRFDQTILDRRDGPVRNPDRRAAS
jgi:integrase